MKYRVLEFMVTHRRGTILLAMLVVMLLVGGVGEVAAHNPAGQPVPGCENGAEIVAEKNPTCHR